MEKITSTNCWLQCVTLMLALLRGVLAMPVDVDRECMAPSTAKYRLTFTGKWSQTAFPKHYPLYRPPAQWSPIFGEYAHRNHYLLENCDDLNCELHFDSKICACVRLNLNRIFMQDTN